MTDTPPRWAVLAGLALAAAGIALYVLGRGGTVMLFVVALLFAAFAVPMLSMRDRLADDDADDD
ncbi:MAG TPA: hypothetical protein VFX49_08255 [Chloroflexota bacterium]|nr:hypothetical protein [Chloroflexota bacterium]